MTDAEEMLERAAQTFDEAVAACCAKFVRIALRHGWTQEEAFAVLKGNEAHVESTRGAMLVEARDHLEQVFGISGERRAPEGAPDRGRRVGGAVGHDAGRPSRLSLRGGE